MSDEALFSVRDRTETGPRRGTESSFEFLDRVAGPFWDRLRALIDAWFTDYPAIESFDLAQRFRSDDDQHDAAWWELYLHRVLTATGRRLTPHPEVPGTTKRPDFLVEEPGGDAWYLEATTVAPAGQAAERRRGVLVDSLNSIKNDDFFVSISWRETGSSSPPARDLRARVTDWLGGLDPDEVLKMPAGELPTLTWEYDDWVLVLGARPKEPGSRGRPGRIVGAQVLAAWEGESRRLRRALDAKVGKYGDLSIPFVVALRTTVPFEVMDGLPMPPDRRVSALLLAGPEFQPWSVNEITPALIHNEAATRRLSVDLAWPCVRTTAEVAAIETRPASATPVVLGIPPDFAELKAARFPSLRHLLAGGSGGAQSM